MAELNTARGPMQPSAQSLRRYQKKFPAWLGAFFILLALLGLVTLAGLLVRLTYGFLDNSSEKEEFKQFLVPIVMFDPIPFDNAQNADPLFLLQTSMWSTMLSEKRDTYAWDDLGRMIIPASDLDVTCAQVYGMEVKLQHQSFGDYETTYVYDEERKTYYAMAEGMTGVYTPYIADRVIKNGDHYTLFVGYISPANIWSQGRSEAESLQKYMVYDLLRVKGHYQLLSIRDPKREELEGLPEPAVPLQGQ
ncbi:MAG: hypothetical protein HFG20_02280 [Anaerotruncus sp.]|nr:hypothetical protein [Anaerotruncus sp.]